MFSVVEKTFKWFFLSSLSFIIYFVFVPVVHIDDIENEKGFVLHQIALFLLAVCQDK